ncbi:MAG: ABC transporter permease [Acidimicrobiales bacterium]
MKVAFIELRRRPGRFAPAAIALVLLTVLLLVLTGLLDGLYDGQTGAYRSQPGQLLTFSSTSKLNLNRSTLDPVTIAQVAAVPGVEQVGGLGVTPLSAIVPDRTELASVALFGYQLGSARLPAPPQEKGRAYADRSLESAGVKVGQALGVGPNGYPVTVVGWVEDTDYSLQGSLWASVDTWREATASARPDAVRAPGSFPALTVVVSPGSSVTDVAPAIDSAAAGATETVTRSEAISALGGVDQQNATFTAIIGVTFFVAALVVALFFALLTLERSGTYGVFKALGASTGQIFSGVVAQALVVAGAAFVVGGLISLVSKSAIPPEVPLQFSGARAVEVLVGLLAMSALGAALSLRRVVRIDPASAIG